MKVKNELIREEIGWSSFEETEAKAMVNWLLSVVFGEHQMSNLDRACLLEIGYNSRWWVRCRHICNKHDLKDLVNLICLGHVSVNGLGRLGMNNNEKLVRKLVDKTIMFIGRITWMNGSGNCDRAQEYPSKTQCPMNEKYVYGGVGATVRIMARGGCLPLRGSTRMSCGVCGDVEPEKHVLLDCNLYMDVRRRWKEKLNADHADMYDVMKGFEVNNECIENETMCYLGMVWSARQRSEQSKVLYQPINSVVTNNLLKKLYRPCPCCYI